MEFLTFAIRAFLILYCVMIITAMPAANPARKPGDKRRVKHERIQASGGRIGFVPTKYHSN